MTTTPHSAFLDDFSSSETNVVSLSETTVAWAIDMQKDIVDLETQWQTFIRSLAIAGFEQWLNEGAFDWDISYARSQAPNKGINFRVNDYRLSVLPMSTSGENTVEIITSKRQSAHLYILIEVQEEADQIHLIGGLRSEQLQPLLSKIETTSEEEVLEVPIAYFSESPEQILLQLSCLAPAQAKEFVDYRPQANLAKDISTQVTNVRQWLQNQVETLSEQLSWALLPPINPAAAMRPIHSTVDRILETLSLQGIRLPEQAGGATSSITVGQLTCQLYAWAWPVESSETPEWGLFLLLGPSESAGLPTGTKLQVSDCEGTLAQEQLTDTSATSYLYAQVQGIWPERFWARIVLPNGSEVTLPAFCFESV